MENFKVVKNANLLRSMEKQGLIMFHPQTLTKITGLYSSKKFTCYYIDEAPYRFVYKGRTYGQKFFSGCFCPYLVEYLD